MNSTNKPDSSSAILEAIRAKREHKSGTHDIAELEAALIADIDAFDLDGEEKRARREQVSNAAAGMVDPTLVFPSIDPDSGPRHANVVGASAENREPTSTFDSHSPLLEQLRQQATQRQQELHNTLAEHTAINKNIDRVLKHLFFYLHDFVQQLNIVKPAIPREYFLTEQQVLTRFTWQEGFADYRAQAQSAGALVELVSFSCHLGGNGPLHVERNGLGIDRFRNMLFDYGLQFSCQEFRNQRSIVERAVFEIRSELNVSARWSADFEKGMILLDTRNLERLGSARYQLQPQSIDESLLDEFGRLLLGQANRFRELATRRKG